SKTKSKPKGKTVTVPTKIPERPTLWDHQKVAVQQMQQHEHKFYAGGNCNMGILSLDVGAGKTAAMLHLLMSENGYAGLRTIISENTPLLPCLADIIRGYVAWSQTDFANHEYHHQLYPPENAGKSLFYSHALSVLE